MKENRYDDEKFFEKYSEMTRSKLGLKGAGEWHEFRKLLPDFNGKTVLDLGCGYGWHCKYAEENGALSVLGADISEKMLEKAREINGGAAIIYRKAAIEDYEYPNETYDAVISSLAIHYVEDYEKLVKDVYKTLKKNGDFVFSVEHPIFTAEGSEDWIKGENGEILHFPIDNYSYEGMRETVFLGEKVVKYHRTLTTYIGALLKAGFTLRALREPTPPEDMMELPGMADELRRPMMLIIAARK